MKIIDGKKIASEIKEKLKSEISEQKLNPSLAIIKVGDNPASEIYVRNKIKACEEIGIKSFLYEKIKTEEELIKLIEELNQNKEISGILVQSPLPSGFDEDKITNLIRKSKDVDGFGIENLGYLAKNEEQILSATPYGIITILEHEKIPIEGRHVVIIGRSKIVGRPLALALLNRDATVTICHSKTNHLKEIAKTADILIVAIGKPKFITKEYVKENAVVIDVGINRINNEVIGDVDFEDVKDIVSYITPVPGGVGPMTIVSLLRNTINANKRRSE